MTMARGKTKIIPRPQRWLHNLCDCCQDPTLTCSVCVCSCNATGQMYQRTTGNGCFAVSLFLWVVFVISQVLTTTSNSIMRSTTADSYTTNVSIVSIVGSVAGLLGLISTIASTYFICTARQAVRARDEIPEGVCGTCDDCCAAYWCGCCSLIQMFRQEKITGNEYRVCTRDAI